MQFLDVTLKKRAEEEDAEEEHKIPPYDWCFENSINFGTIHLDVKEQPFKYDKWRTNTTLSNHADTVLYANQMNTHHDITDQMHYDYLFNSIRKTKRYAKKKTDQDKARERHHREEMETLALIQEYYGYNMLRAREALKILTEDQLEIIKNRLEKGGPKTE